jgi:hypothetical protein
MMEEELLSGCESGFVFASDSTLSVVVFVSY